MCLVSSDSESGALAEAEITCKTSRIFVEGMVRVVWSYNWVTATGVHSGYYLLPVEFLEEVRQTRKGPGRVIWPRT